MSGTDILLTHETHRGRFSYSPIITLSYIEAYPSIKLTTDFSHWCVVSVSLLANHQTFLDKAIEKAFHIHARVGNQQSPQLNDPFAPNTLKRYKDILSGGKK